MRLLENGTTTMKAPVQRLVAQAVVWELVLVLALVLELERAVAMEHQHRRRHHRLQGVPMSAFTCFSIYLECLHSGRNRYSRWLCVHWCNDIVYMCTQVC